MTLALEIATGLFLLAILGMVAVAARRRNVSALVNGLVALCAALLPFGLELLGPFLFSRTVAIGPALPLWIAVAGAAHSLGMLGYYESVWWWDHFTHTLSAAFVAALVYASVIVAQHSNPLPVGPGWVGVTTVALVLLVGVGWELLEVVAREVAARYDVEPILVHYGWRDTVYDLAFDLIGALLVLLVDLRLFVPLAGRTPHVTELLLVAVVVLLGGSLLIGLALVLHLSLDR